MGKLIFILVVIVFSTLIFYTCEVPRSYPDTPEVKFKSLLIQDSIDIQNPNNSKKKMILTISVIDGDGDIGILGNNNYKYPPFEDMDYIDLYITLLEKTDTGYVELSPWNFGTPYLEPEGQDKTLKADLEVTMDVYKNYLPKDTFKYSFYIYDRAMHKSNIAESPAIQIDTTGLIE